MNRNAIDCFGSEGVWLKGNLHSHTTRSDGQASPQELADWYDRNGYDFLAITDHNTITDVAALKTEQLLLIAGVEFGYCPKGDPGFVLDMLGVNVSKFPEFLDPEEKNCIRYDAEMNPQQIIDWVNEAGGIAIMCHPYFMINMIEPYLRYHSYLGLEAYNYVCEEMCGRGHHEIYWDALLFRGKKLLGFATDDSHACQFGYAWIEVKAEKKDTASILDAIRKGNYYSTNGVRIFDVTLTDGVLRISFDRPCDVVVQPTIGAITRSYENKAELVDGKPRYSVERRIPADLDWFRVELIDAHGKKAYLNPVWLKD